MKAKHLTAMIVCALLISLTGCTADKIAPTPTHNVDGTMNTEVAAEPVGEAEAATPTAETAEKEMPVQPTAVEASQTSVPQEPAQVKESEAPKQTEAPRQSESTGPSAPSAPPEPTPTEPPALVETEPPVETQPKTAYDYEFDIDAIRADCIAIGQSMGYTLNTSLTPQNATWWNPVTASESNQGSALRSGLEQYVRFHTVSNLSAYGLDEITEFNICCESRGGGAYAIYFVFA